jgi:hypothetical protein
MEMIQPNDNVTNDDTGDDEADETMEDDVTLKLKLKDLSISINDKDTPSEPRLRYMLDYTLNRFCRWLRILGLDAALETEEEERLRTKEGKL